MAENDPIAETTPIENAAPKPTPGARPGPKPHPGPRPGGPRPHAPAAQAAPRTRPASDPSKHGRVDEDGTVYVVTSGGERAVGSWQAGESAEGLAHYGRKYDELATEAMRPSATFNALIEAL